MRKLITLLPLIALFTGCTMLGITDPAPGISVEDQVYNEGRMAGEIYRVVKTMDGSEVTDLIDVVLKQASSGDTIDVVDKAVYAVLLDRYDTAQAKEYYNIYWLIRSRLVGYIDDLETTERMTLVLAFLEGMNDAGYIEYPIPDTPQNEIDGLLKTINGG